MNGGQTILLMEPSTIGRLGIGRMLGGFGLTVVACSNLDEAEARVRALPRGALRGVVAAMHAGGIDDAKWLGQFGAEGQRDRVPALGLSSDSYLVLPEGVCGVVDRRLSLEAQGACLGAWLGPARAWNGRVLTIGISRLRATLWERHLAGGGIIFLEDMLDAGAVAAMQRQAGTPVAVAVINPGLREAAEVVEGWRAQAEQCGNGMPGLIVCPGEEAFPAWLEMDAGVLAEAGVVEIARTLTPPWMVAKMRFHALAWRARRRA